MGIFQKIEKKLKDHAEYSESIMTLFGWFGLFNYPFFYLYWICFLDTVYDDYFLRLGAMFFCLIIVLKDHWNKKLKPFFPLYWYIAVCYCLPFFVTYNFLQDPSSSGFSLNFMLALFWLIALLDWASFFIILPTGVGAALIVYKIQGGIIHGSIMDVLGIVINVSFVIITALLFLRKKDISYKEKIQTMKMLAGTIAHELRTPLASIGLSADVLTDYTSLLEEIYKEVENPTLSKERLEKIAVLPKDIRRMSNNAQTTITMLLTKLNEEMENKELEKCSMNNCIEEALNAYPFFEKERQYVHWSKTKDFLFLGQKELMKHVLFNLIKNALYAISSIGRGEISIVIEPEKVIKGKIINRLIFKDTGPGVAKEYLEHIFDRFYSKSRYGTGIGLAFCQSVIRSWGGNIICCSKQKEYTEFIIDLPQL